MTNRKAIKQELVAFLNKNKEAIVKEWALRIMQVPGYRLHKDIISAEKHKKEMTGIFSLFISFLKNKSDKRIFAHLTPLINEGYLSISTAEDVIHGQMILRKILARFLVSRYKNNLDKLTKMVDLIASILDIIILHISKMYKTRSFRRLHTLVNAGRRLAHTRDLERLTKLVVETAARESNADTVSLMLIDKDGFLKIKASIGIPDAITKSAAQRAGKGIAGMVIKSKSPIIINEGTKVSKAVKRAMRGLSISSALCLPIITDNRAIGVLSLGKYYGKPSFDNGDAELLSILACEAGTSIKTCKLFEETESLYAGSIYALAAAIDARDHYTHGHSKKVASYATKIAKELKLPKSKIDIIKRASLLHDIGKIGIPDKILNKPGRLTRKEYEVVKRHPRVGVKIVKSIPGLDELLPAIYHEHERYDGKGYVAGLKGEDIPIEARIIAVADAYDAMRTKRPYRGALSKEKAISELKKNSGTQFDTEVIKVFLKILKDYRY